MSNRSSHFVHGLQTLPSALAGGSRRLTALAAVFALLTLTLLPTTGQAQTYNTEDDPRAPRNLSALGRAPMGWSSGGSRPPRMRHPWTATRSCAAGPTGTSRRSPRWCSDTGNADTTYFDAKAIEGGVRYTYRVMAIRNGVRSSDRSNIAIVLRPPSAPPPPLVSNIGQSASATANDQPSSTPRASGWESTAGATKSPASRSTWPLSPSQSDRLAVDRRPF